MDVLRTPDERFTNLPDHPFAPHHATIVDADGGPQLAATLIDFVAALP